MKKLKLLFTVLCVLCGTVVFAHDFEVSGIYYNITNATKKTVAVTYKGNSYSAYSNEYTGNVVIPVSVIYNGTTYSVTSIGYGAFSYCSGLTSITIPNSVTSIGDYAFYDCLNLKTVYNYSNLTFTKGSTDYGSVARYADKLYNAPNGSVEGDYIFNRSNDVNTLLYYLGNDTEITLPADYYGESYVIGQNAFNGCSRLTSITIPNSVTSIGSSAFSGCSGLTSITIPNSVTSIGQNAFKGCYRLTSITIGNSVTSIGNSAFDGCSGLKSITIPNSVTSIGSSAFSGCSGLTSITIPNSVTSIDQNAFKGCSRLTSITIGNSVTSIGQNAFNGCSSLTSITIGNSVTSIGAYAFRDCPRLTSITIGNSVTSIGNYAFDGCTSLKELRIEDGTKTLSLGFNYNNSSGIGQGLFYDCPLKKLYLGRNLSYKATKNHGYSPFYDKETLTSVTVGDSVTSIGRYAFEDCGLTSITIPTSVTIIGEKAFSGCDLTSITIPNSVTSIGNYTFSTCDFTSITIPNSVTSIGDYAFYCCTGLTSVTIGNSVTSIGSEAFSGCSNLKTVYNYSNLTFTKGSPDYGYVAYYAEKVINAPNASIEGDFVFGKPNGVNTLVLYLGNDTEIVLPENYKGKNYAIGAEVFKGKTSITSVVIPNSVTSIGSSAFSGCSGLTSIEIPNSVTSIGNSAFYACSKLKTVYNFSNLTFTKGSTDYGYVAYYAEKVINAPNASIEGDFVFGKPNGVNTLVLYLGNDTEIVLPENYKGKNYAIGAEVFKGKTSITSVVIPNSVTSIGSSAFSGCSGLTSIEIPNSVTSIGDYTFSGCAGLTNITIPNSVISIGTYAFNNCNNLESLYIGNSIQKIGDYAFYGCNNLFDIKVANKKVITISYNVFSVDSYNNAVLYVPTGRSTFYKNTAPWSNFIVIEEFDFDNIEITGITLNKSTVTITEGETETLVTTIIPSNATDKTITWKTSNSAVATVSNGVVTAVKAGTATITATAGGYSATCVVTVEAKEEPEEPLTAGKYYKIKNVATGLYLQVSGNNTNMTLQEKSDARLQIFTLEDDGEGKFYIKSTDADNCYYAHATTWNFNATTNANNKTPFTIALLNGETNIYTLYQNVTENVGLAGTDSSNAGAFVFCDKRAENNGKWAFEVFTDEDRIAAAMATLENAIANAESVLKTRAQLLTDDEKKAISAAVQTANDEKGNTNADVTAEIARLTALSEMVNNAVGDAIYVNAIDEISNAVCYTVSTESRGAWYSEASNLNSTGKLNIAYNITDNKQQFAFIKSPTTGNYYLYSVSEAKFVSKNGDYTTLTETPVQTITFLTGERTASYPWIIALNTADGEKQIAVSNTFEYGIITFYNDLTDAGNTVRLEKVATFDATAALALINAYENGETAIEEVNVENVNVIIYDLQGLRVKEITEGGIYIINGKKVLVK